MPAKKTLRRKRAPSKRVSNVVSLPPVRPTLQLDAALSTNLLLDLAMAYHSSAEFSKDQTKVAIAGLLDAAWLMRWRHERDTAERAEAAELQRAVAKYLSTRAAGEHWALIALSPLPGNDRAEAIRKLRSHAEVLIAHARKSRSVDRDRAAKMVATVLLARVEQVGLAVDQIDRSGVAGEANSWSMLLDELLSRRPRVHRVVAQALECRGVSPGDATNWARAAVNTPVK